VIDAVCPAKFSATFCPAVPFLNKAFTPSVGNCAYMMLSTPAKSTTPPLNSMKLLGITKSGVMMPRSANPCVATRTLFPSVPPSGKLLGNM
jgi:hypothetical protein